MRFRKKLVAHNLLEMERFMQRFNWKKSISRMLDDSGATLVEYGVALLVVIIVGSAAISALGNAVGDEIAETADAF
jgi:Flp pilus assembly pilin Flp